MKITIALLCGVMLAASHEASAAGLDPFASIRFDRADGPAAPTASPVSWFAIDDGVQTSAPPPRAFVYSDGYNSRARWHKRASYAILPLFGVEAWLGQRLFNNPALAGGGARTAHAAVAAAIGGLFAVNSVTGTWNLIEGNKDPNRGIRPVVHGVLMLVADAGFFATALTAPSSHSASGLAIYDPKKNQHMALAYASISTATVGYVMMLFK